ncbi:O-antigen ligase family protein [Leptospira sp. 96542]|nr:O-antigen ligase family protein [Leptospira sp. 96542]
MTDLAQQKQPIGLGLIFLNGFSFSILGTLFLVPGAASIPTLMTLLASASVLATPHARTSLIHLFTHRDSRWIAWPFLIWPIGSMLIAGISPSGLFDDFPHLQLRFVFALSLLALSLLIKPRPSWLLWSLPFAAMLAAAHAGYSIFVEALPRAQAWGAKGMNPIYFGNWSMMIAVLIVIISALATSLSTYLRIGLLVTATLAAWASLASGSRSSLFALGALFPMLLLLRKDKFHRLLVFFILGFIALFALISFNSTTVQRHLRLDSAAQDIAQLRENNHVTSIGTRIVIWQAAWSIFKDHPFTGIGSDGFKREYLRMMEAKEIPAAEVHSQAHSDLLQAMVSRGLVGLLSYVLVIIGPLIFFTLALRRAADNENMRLYAACGLLVVSVTFLFNLTNANFVSKISSMTYPLLICAFAAQVMLSSVDNFKPIAQRKEHA